MHEQSPFELSKRVGAHDSLGDRGYPGSVTSKEWRTFNLKNGGPEPPTDTATPENGALQLKNGAPQ